MQIVKYKKKIIIFKLRIIILTASKHSNPEFFLSSSGATPNSSEFSTYMMLNGARSQAVFCIFGLNLNYLRQ